MKRLTTNDENHILASLNLFYCKDNEVWIRGGGPEPDYADCTLVDWIVSAAEKHHLDIFSRDAEGMGEEMYDSMQFGSDTIEGIVALLHAAAIQAAEMRGHLVAIEDILGDEYDLDELAEKVQANREGRCVVLPESYYTAEAAARKASGPAEQSERGQAAAWIMQRFGQMS